MKKRLFILLAFVCLLSLTACNTTEEPILPTVVPEVTAPAEPPASIVPSVPDLATESTETATQLVETDLSAAEIVQAAYDNVLQSEIMHIVAERKWFNYDIGTSQAPAGSHLAADVALNMGDLYWDIWRKNETGEYIYEHENVDQWSGAHGNSMCQLLCPGVLDDTSYQYRSWGCSWVLQDGEKDVRYTKAAAGYADQLYYNWNVLPSLEDVYSVEVAGSEYIVASQSFVWSSVFLNNNSHTITMRIDADTLHFIEIVIEGENWTETASFEYYEDDEVFFEQVPEDFWTTEINPDDWGCWNFYDSPTEHEFMYSYAEIKEVMEQEPEAFSEIIIME